MKTIQQTQSPRLFTVAAAVAMVVGLAGFSERSNATTVGEKVDAAIERTEKAAATAKQEVRQAGGAVADKAASMSNAVENKVDDMSITAAVNADLARDPNLSALKINVDTKDGVVTLNGPAPNAIAKARATTIAKSAKGVVSVKNQLRVAAN